MSTPGTTATTQVMGGVTTGVKGDVTDMSKTNVMENSPTINAVRDVMGLGNQTMTQTCVDGYTMIDKQCTPKPYLEESSKFKLTCPDGFTLNTNADQSVVCVKNIAGFTPDINMETFSQNNIRNINGKCKARY
jgi:hypothetical protein